MVTISNEIRKQDIESLEFDSNRYDSAFRISSDSYLGRDEIVADNRWNSIAETLWQHASPIFAQLWGFDPSEIKPSRWSQSSSGAEIERTFNTPIHEKKAFQWYEAMIHFRGSTSLENRSIERNFIDLLISFRGMSPDGTDEKILDNAELLGTLSELLPQFQQTLTQIAQFILGEENITVALMSPIRADSAPQHFVFWDCYWIRGIIIRNP